MAAAPATTMTMTTTTTVSSQGGARIPAAASSARFRDTRRSIIASSRAIFSYSRGISSSSSSKRSSSSRQRTTRICSASNQLSNAASPNAHENSDDHVLLLDRCRALLFYVTTSIIAMPLFVVMLLQHPFVLLLDKYRRKAHHFINKVWACLTTLLFYKVDIVGTENLPKPDEPAVYVANHQSFLDIYALFQIGRPFKFISKKSNFFIPIVGWAMYLTGHVPLRRLDTKSQIECFKRCIQVLKEGASVFFFPEGTRSRDGRLSEFKKGAFTIAAKAKVAVVPIALVGTGKLMPQESILRSGGIKIVIQPPIRGDSAEELCVQSRSVISRALLEHGGT